MTNRLPITRRGLPRLLVSLAALMTSSRLTLGAGPRDQGIGGTGEGVGPDQETGDRGIGGTGVIGTIRRFGSIVVNGLRIAYPENAEVFIDEAPATPADLKLGHVVAVLAARTKGGLSTRRIAVTSEVVGPVEAIGEGELIVLGQHVVLADVGFGQIWRLGEHVAVSGLRRPDGTIMASLIERRAGDEQRVAGPVRRDRDGDLTIGTLKLDAADPRWLDQRRVLIGRGLAGRFQVTRVASAPLRAELSRRIPRLSVEAYVERGPAGLILGSGLPVRGGRTASAVPQGCVFRAILTTSVGPSGQLTLDALHIEPSGRSGGGGHNHGGFGGDGTAPGAAGPGPMGTGPMGTGPMGPGPMGPMGPGLGDMQGPFGNPGGYDARFGSGRVPGGLNGFSPGGSPFSGGHGSGH